MDMGTIFAIKKYAIHDGPNIRTTVFLKGCPLRCPWCHNPEGMSKDIVLIAHEDRCSECDSCIETCPSQSLCRQGDRILRDKNSCTLCQQCLNVCPACVYESTGWEATVGEIISELQKDILFYDQSGGGVTFSGGEPLMQSGFLLELLKCCGALGIHRVVDTSAYAETKCILEVAQETDMFLIDLKHLDSAKHRHFTGVPNDLILHNIRVLAEKGTEMCLRIPLIEGFNCDDRTIKDCGEFIAALPGNITVDLLPYHAIGAAKYRKLALDYPAEHLRSVSPQKIARFTELLTHFGLNVQVGG